MFQANIFFKGRAFAPETEPPGELFGLTGGRTGCCARRVAGLRRWLCFAPVAYLAVIGCGVYPKPDYLALLLLQSRPSLNPIKRVSGFSTTMTANPQLIFVQPVDTSRAFVVCAYRAGNASFAANRSPTCSLISPNQVSVEMGTTDGNVAVAGFVAEFSSGVTVQRGTLTLGAGTLSSNQSISTVDPSKAFVLVQARTADGGTLIDEHRTTMGYLSGPSQITVVRNQGTITTVVEWQVVEMAGASVQRGLSQIPGGSSSVSIPITAVDTARSFSVVSVAGANASNGNDSEIWTRCNLSSAALLLCERNDTVNAPDIAWQVVSLSDAISVQRGTEDTNTNTPPANNTDTTMTATLLPVDLSASIVLTTSSVDPGDLDSGQDSAAFASVLGSATSITIQRGSPDDRRGTVSWQAIQFAR